MMRHTLILNATYEPLQIVSWKRAIRMLFQEKVEVVEVYDRQICSISLTIRLPAVVRLLHYVRVKRRYNRVKFSRSNLFARDNFTCQYCGSLFLSRDLTYDHVLPVARGGRKSWENIVTCCVPCNRQKGDRIPEEAGLQLRKRPKAPVGFPSKVQFMLSRTAAPESWKTYIFWQDSGWN